MAKTLYNATETTEIEFIHPEAFGKNNNYGVDYSFSESNGKIMTRAIMPCKWNNESKKFDLFKKGAILGTYTLEEIEMLAEGKTVRDVSIMTVVQMEEIDGAKTGYRPTVPEECMYRQNPVWLIARQKFLGRLPMKYEEKSDGTPNYDNWIPQRLKCTTHIVLLI